MVVLTPLNKASATLVAFLALSIANASAPAGSGTQAYIAAANAEVSPLVYQNPSLDLKKRGFTFTDSEPESYEDEDEENDEDRPRGRLVRAESILRRLMSFPSDLKKNFMSQSYRTEATSEDTEEVEDKRWVDELVDEEDYYGDEFENDAFEEDDDYDDCDNGNDDDDGSQWHTKKASAHLDRSSGFNRPVRTRFSRETSQGLAPFPKWLADITHLTQWPGRDAPFIPMAGINLTGIPDVPRRELGDCTKVTLEHCSFDCYRCMAVDEMMTCSVMSQTFDDGPSPGTPKLLDHLPTKTTFFTQGINVVRFPDTFREQHAKGHLLASHTWSHSNLAGVSNEEITAQIQWSIWAMNATAGIIPKFFRPPYGASDNRVRAIIRQFGLMSVFWDHDTFDWQVNDKKKTPEQVILDVKGWKQDLSKGGIILEHDSTIDTVNLGVDVAKVLGSNQFTVADCINSKWYQTNVTWQ
ncbi:uncharacterized protein SAPINGB_P003010 [Magnusiomyces paraingens]|uniref:chitin deacetylase n=1 Tax=Magnusiomyces paraingens TaxID=2606893 RepID=A0A5E8BJN7_9ASCO|nr:uncharacterized protein SAPINGB_P003010 [Saprochaete ingens]VVT51179.1 unnamed protein product [Saprochaete ingens]